MKSVDFSVAITYARHLRDIVNEAQTMSCDIKVQKLFILVH